jgi:hypothetical protein
MTIRVVEPGTLQCSGIMPEGDGVIKGAGNYTEGAAVTSWTYDDSADSTKACLWRCEREKGYKRAGNSNRCVYLTNLDQSEIEEREEPNKILIIERIINKTLIALENINKSEVDLTALELIRNNLTEASAFVIIRNLTLPSGKTKTLYLRPQNAGANAVCVADRDNVQSKDDILASCLQVRCPGSADRYSCEVAAGEFVIKGLLYSGIIEQTIVEQPPAGGGETPSGGGGGDYVPPKPKEKPKENVTLPKPIVPPEEEKKGEEIKNASLADKIQRELEKRIKNNTVRAIVSIVVIGALIAGIIILFVVVWRRVNRERMPRLSESAGVRIK